LRYSVEIQLGGYAVLTGLELHFCFPALTCLAFLLAAGRGWASPLKAKGTRSNSNSAASKNIQKGLPTVLVLIIEPIQILGAADPFGGLGIRVREQPFGTP